MVDRTSQEVSISAGGGVAPQQSGMGYVSPDANKFAENHVYDAPTQTENTGMRILSHIAEVGGKLAEKAFQKSTEEAYLDGMAKAGTISSEKELDGNIVMRQWQTAGYRDTMGRIAAADYEAQIATDMPRMREQSPEKYAEYLAEKRTKLTEQWAGMTTQTRQAMFAQQMLGERASIKRHAVEHYKYGVELEEKAIKASTEASFTSLNAAKGDAKSYLAATDATFGTVYSNTVGNPKLPKQMQGKILAQVAMHALESDNQALYQQIMNKVVPHQDGTEGPMSNAMDWEDNIALSKAFRASEERTEAFRAMDFGDRTAQMRADWDNPDAPLMPRSTVLKHLEEGVQRKLISAEKYEAILQDYYKSSAKKQVQTNLAQMYQAGDQDGMLRAGKTPQEGLDAFVDAMGSKLGLTGTVDQLLQIGRATGQDNAYRKVGQLLAPAFAQIGNSNIDPANAASIATVMGRLEEADKAGQIGAIHSFLGAFDPETQSKIVYLRDSLRSKVDPTVAIADANARVLADSQLTPAMRAAMASSKAKEQLDVVAESTPVGSVLGKGWLYAKALFSDVAKSELAITPTQSFFENPTRVAAVNATINLELAREMEEQSRANPSMNTAGVELKAKAALANRAVPTTWGPMLVPRGYTPQRYFGTQAGSERIGAALNEFIKPVSKDGRMAFSIGTDGQLWAQELNKDGQPAAPASILNPKQIAPLIEIQRSREVENHRKDYGDGVTVKSGSAGVTYNGDNTAGVDNHWVRKFRDDLVKHEGVRDSVYDDGEGNLTAGVGVLVKHKSGMVPGVVKPGKDGKLTQDQINDSFRFASDRAAGAAKRAMQDTGIKSESAFKLYGSLAYQSGPGFASLAAYKPLLGTIAARDAAAAVAAMKQTPAYKKSGPERQQYYLNQLQAALKG